MEVAVEIPIGLGVLLLIVWVVVQQSTVDSLKRRVISLEGRALWLERVIRQATPDVVRRVPEASAALAAGATVTRPGTKPGQPTVRRPAGVCVAAHASAMGSQEPPALEPTTRVVAAPRVVPSGPTPIERLLGRVRTTDEWEALIGGKWLNRIGAVALILGVGFFLKYAIDQNWISPAFRVAIGFVVGAGLLITATRTHRKGLDIFAQGLVGAGISTLYLCVYASYNFYHLVPQPIALTGMLTITVLAFQQALYYDSMATALLAAVGGFLTPALLSTSHPNETGLFAYLLLLDAGILGIVSRKRSWFVLEPLALVSTALIYLTWALESYSIAHLGLTLLFTTALWVLFFGFEVYGIITSRLRVGPERDIISALTAAGYYGAMFALIYPHHRAWMGLTTILIGLVYSGIVLGTKYWWTRDGNMVIRYTLTTIGLLALATPVQFSGFAIIIAWSIEAAALLYLGVRWNRWFVWQPALALYALAAVVLPAIRNAIVYEPIRHFTPILNTRTLAFLTLAATLAIGAVVVARLQNRNRETIRAVLHVGWCFTLFAWLTLETVDLFGWRIAQSSGQDAASLEYGRLLAVAAIWMLYAMPLIWSGLRARVVPVLASGIAASALSVCLGATMAAAYLPIARYLPIVNIRAGTMALLIAGLTAQSIWLGRRRQFARWIDPVVLVSRAAAGVLIFELLTAGTNDVFRHLASTETRPLAGMAPFVETMTLATVWMIYSLVALWIAAHRRAVAALLLGLASCGLAVGAAATSAIVFEPTAYFGITLGLRVLVLGVVITGLCLELRWLRNLQHEHDWLKLLPLAFQAGIVILGFLLVTGETRDVFRGLIQPSPSQPTSRDAGTLGDLERLALSVVWFAYAAALMGFGIWRRARWLRFGAIALFGVAIVKVFAYDLSFLASAYRSVSFAGLGVILLAVSFVYSRYRAVILDTAGHRSSRGRVAAASTAHTEVV